MKRRIFALALALSLALLAACGGNGGSSSSAPDGAGSSSQSGPSSSVSDGSGSSDSAGDESLLPDGSDPAETPDASQPDSSAGEVEEPATDGSLTLSKSDFTLFSAGATWQLKAQSDPTGGTRTWTSSDESVATVSDKGVVTAVGNGTATITVTDSKTGLSASCIVRCRWDEKTPDGSQGGSSSSGDSSQPGDSSGADSSQPSGSVDLTAFAEQTMSDHEFGRLQLLDASLLDSLYPGLSAVGTEQCLVYGTMMTMNNGEFALIQVKDSADVDTVKGVLQTRIDGMINGGAWYPEPTRIWTECSRVVSNGNYVMMVVHEDCDAIVDAFNALF